jgi:hypothetical protein
MPEINGPALIFENDCAIDHQVYGFNSDLTRSVISGSLPADSDLLTYDAASGKWKNKPIAATGVTPGTYSSADITVDAQGRITAAATGAGAGGFSSLAKFRRTTLVVADGVNVIGANPSYSVGDIWAKVRSDNLTNFFDASGSPFMACSSFAPNNFGQQTGIFGKKNYATGKNIHALGIGARARITNVDFWFVVAGSVGSGYGANGFAPDGNPTSSVPFAAFRFSTTQGDTHYKAMTCSGSGITTVDTGDKPCEMANSVR